MRQTILYLDFFLAYDLLNMYHYLNVCIYID